MVRVGLAALVVIVLAGVAAYFGVKWARGNGGYEMAVHFPTASGVAPGSQVFLNGVNIGSVDKVRILPDASVDFILDISRGTPIPADAKFSVQSALTGSPIVAISAPPHYGASFYPKRILPIADQPIGSPPLTLEIFMRNSRVVGDRAMSILAQARPYEKGLIYNLQNTRSNAGAAASEMRAALPALRSSLQETIARARGNVSAAQSALRERNQAKIEALANSLSGTVADMKRTTGSLAALKRDPTVQGNIRSSQAQLRTVTGNLAGLSHDLEMMTGNPQTKAQLRDAGARLREIMRQL